MYHILYKHSVGTLITVIKLVASSVWSRAYSCILKFCVHFENLNQGTGITSVEITQYIPIYTSNGLEMFCYMLFTLLFFFQNTVIKC